MAQTVTTYSIDELEESAKDKALEHLRYHGDDWYGWHSENVDSLNAFARAFNITKLDYAYGGHRGAYCTGKVAVDSNQLALSGHRLAGWLWTNYKTVLYSRKAYRRGTKTRHSRIILEESCCGFTGYCMDETLLDEIRAFMAKPDNRTLEDLLADCLSQWAFACDKDSDYAYSDEALTETAQANDYQFLANGQWV